MNSNEKGTWEDLRINEGPHGFQGMWVIARAATKNSFGFQYAKGCGKHDCCLELAVPIGLSLLTLVLSLNPFPSQVVVPMGLSPMPLIY